MKYIFYYLLILISFNSNAQRIRGFAAISGYLDNDFKKSAFVEVGAGIEGKINRFLKPEIATSYFAGALEDDINRDSQGNAIDLLTKKTSALNFSITPKICLCAKEINAGDLFFQILPRYNISRIEAVGDYIIINQSNPSKSISKKEIVSQWQHSLGIGIGLDIILSDKNYDSFSVNLHYNGVNMGQALTQLNHNKASYSTNNTFGFGMIYYCGFTKKKA